MLKKIGTWMAYAGISGIAALYVVGLLSVGPILIYSGIVSDKSDGLIQIGMGILITLIFFGGSFKFLGEFIEATEADK